MKFEFSAGGVVFKKDPSAGSGQDKIWILLAQHSQHHGWVFPKGLIGDHPSANSGQVKETKEDAALREVKEETGADGKIIKSLSETTFWYVFNGEKIKKTVYYFLMEYLDGDISKHDHEMENVEWLEAYDVEKRLTYKSEKTVWIEAKRLIENSV